MSEKNRISQEKKKKMNHNTVATKALANFMGSSIAWLTLLSHLELRSEGQVFAYHMGRVGTLGETSP